MHNCEEFRERITELIIDREDVGGRTEFQHELLICAACAEFYAESRDMMDALSSLDLSISEIQWKGIEYRLHARIVSQQPAEKRGHSSIWKKWALTPVATTTELEAVTHVSTRGQTPFFPNRATTPFLLAAAALMIITIGLSRVGTPVVGVQNTGEPAAQTTYVERSVLLDPVTVDFLEESELLLRNVMKIEPNDVDDLADAKKAANEQLAGIKLRKEAAADVPPVVNVMDTYESILRDLRNVDERSAPEDIPDIQKRIQKNALIANMKAFQPAVMEVGLGLR